MFEGHKSVSIRIINQLIAFNIFVFLKFCLPLNSSSERAHYLWNSQKKVFWYHSLEIEYEDQLWPVNGKKGTNN